jgi:hypothetical protein
MQLGFMAQTQTGEIFFAQISQRRIIFYQLTVFSQISLNGNRLFREKDFKDRNIWPTLNWFSHQIATLI